VVQQCKTILRRCERFFLVLGYPRDAVSVEGQVIAQTRFIGFASKFGISREQPFVRAAANGCGEPIL
jgi:deoxyinosine 3'endonuclease (endonuclease V)